MGQIITRNLSKSYGDKEIIKNLNIKVKEGSFTVLVGPSGCGKSTILRMLAGLEDTTSGEIFINDKNMEKVRPGKRNIAMVFQNYALYPTMTVRGNIEYGLKNTGVSKEERAKLVDEIAHVVGLSSHLSKKPQFLSGGERQRVALARAMVKKPSVFLMDEPLSNLDAKLRNQMRAELIELHRRLGATFVYVTHDQVEAMSMGTEVILLNFGEVQQSDTPSGIYNNPVNVFTAQFIGMPPMNIIPTDKLGEWDFPENVDYIGFRPEKAKLQAPDYHESEKRIVLECQLATHEMLGAETLYKMHSTYGDLFVKLYEDRDTNFGDVVISVKFKHLYFFDSNKKNIGNDYAGKKKKFITLSSKEEHVE